ncbi:MULTISPECIES: histidine kinase [Thermocrispum]|uniref:histidine kinase n=2 Tax=Thermocrispum agreste TaxID=37925 RepID=A0ABD6FII3_9PSEU|nr:MULTISPECIES: histidine kinase [Thermocrispum]
MSAGRLPAPLSLYRALPIWQQNALIAAGMFLLGCLLYASGLYRLFAPPEPELPWWRIAVFGAFCLIELARRRAPGVGLAAGLLMVGVDAWFGLTLPVMVVFSDLLFAATLYGSQRLSRAMVPAVAVTIIGGLALALVVASDWRAGVAALAALASFLVIPVWWATNVRQQREIAESERANAEQLAEIARLDRQAAVANERARMARDLHDVVAGHLSAIAIQSAAALNMAKHPERADQITTVLQAVRDNSVAALAEMRAMIGLLRTEGAETDGATAPAGLADLPKLVESARASGMTVDVRTELDEATQLPAAVDLTAYRIAQEALTNAIKHAPGCRAELTLRRRDGKVEIVVTNELSDETSRIAGQQAGGVGLLSMRERAKAVGGTVQAGPGGRGWLVCASLPVRSGGAYGDGDR